MEKIHTNVFREVLNTHLKKAMRPPTVADLGGQIRKTKTFVTARSVIEEMLSTARGLPAEDEAAGILRVTPGGVILPVKSSTAGDTFKIKLQDPEHIEAFYSLEEKVPTRGHGASMLLLPKSKEKRGLKATASVMAAAPARARGHVPKGKAATRRFPSLKLSHQLVFTDENADVTFGREYPPWMKQRLRARAYKAIVQMGQRHLPVDAAWYSLIQSKLADPSLTGRWAETSPPLPPPPPPPLPKSKGGSPAATIVKSKAAKKKKLTDEAYAVEQIVEEAGAWGGHKRWFLVEWSHEGYEPGWERWRSPGCGQPGTPVRTWLPLRKVCTWEAFQRWEADATGDEEVV